MSDKGFQNNFLKVCIFKTALNLLFCCLLHLHFTSEGFETMFFGYRRNKLKGWEGRMEFNYNPELWFYITFLRAKSASDPPFPCFTHVPSVIPIWLLVQPCSEHLWNDPAQEPPKWKWASDVNLCFGLDCNGPVCLNWHNYGYNHVCLKSCKALYLSFLLGGGQWHRAPTSSLFAGWDTVVV